jgi:hypothetical protein
VLDGGLIALVDRTEIAVLTADGKFFARASFDDPQSGRVAVAQNSAVVASPDGRTVAFLITEGWPGASVMRWSVPLLERGDARARIVYSARHGSNGCGAWAELSW